MDGFICIDKERGQSSHQAVAALKRLFRCKCGHCGTLDPEATGVLPVALGKATRLSEYVMGQEKTYRGEICFGVETDTYDAAGNCLSQVDASFVTEDAVKALLPRFQGRIMQTPPVISALKQDGEPLYKKARRGETVEVEARPVMIYAMQLIDFTPGATPHCRIEVVCGQGAYIRSIAHDLGQMLGCGAHLCALRRTRVGNFHIENSYTLEQISCLAGQGEPSFLRPMPDALSHLPAFVAPRHAMRLLTHGNEARLSREEAAQAPWSTLLQILDGKGILLGMGSVEQGSGGPVVTMRKVLIDEAEYRVPADVPVVCAIGNFDGLHLGHQALMKELNRLKEQYHGKSSVLTFSPHPLLLIQGQSPLLLTGKTLKQELMLESFGVDQVIILAFNQKLMNSSPSQFVEEVIVPLGVREVVVGYNFTFAARGAGNAFLLRQECEMRNIRVSIIKEVDSRFGTISSSNIRRHLAEGDLDAVNTMLGYWFTMEGEVIYGNQIGRTLGFPTANFLPEEGQAPPSNGVYAGRICCGGNCYDGVINFGVKPTIGGEIQPMVEAHLFDADVNLYGKTARVYLGKFLRPERRFSDLPALQAQIEADSRAAREFLIAVSENQHLPKQIL